MLDGICDTMNILSGAVNFSDLPTDDKASYGYYSEFFLWKIHNEIRNYH